MRVLGLGFRGLAEGFCYGFRRLRVEGLGLARLRVLGFSKGSSRILTSGPRGARRDKVLGLGV